jgi:hypothetical protein
VEEVGEDPSEVPVEAGEGDVESEPAVDSPRSVLLVEVRVTIEETVVWTVISVVAHDAVEKNTSFLGSTR